MEEFRQVLLQIMSRQNDADNFDSIMAEVLGTLSRQRKEILDSLEEGLGEEFTIELDDDGYPLEKSLKAKGYNVLHSYMKEEIKKLR